ncbi:MAG: GTPase HflX [Ruminococcaceae bacterium]|nr:GTPase HflX [Oscillospiraceae bacterium]
MLEKIKTAEAILVGVNYGGASLEETEKSLEELERLLETAGGVCFAKVIQNKEHPDPRTCIGSGKVAEIRDLCTAYGVELVIFDPELSPAQIRNLEDSIGEGIRVIDRSMLILDIFALHAVSGEGKLQVELAQLKYTAPRLMGKGTELSRLGGGIGTRGPGESKLESDRRHMKRRIAALEEELRVLDRTRRTMRAARDRSGIKKVAIVGYTNAGKSTLLNRLTDAGILAEDKLFATLDPTTRKLTLPNGESVLLTDTVGFIRKLPHHLIHAFKSTLDEAVYADVLLIVVDASDPEYAEQLATTEELLGELGASDKPTLYVFNKCDRGAVQAFRSLGTYADNHRSVTVSALTGQGIERMLAELQELLEAGKKRVEFHIPNAEAGALNLLYRSAVVENVEYGAEEILVTATVDAKTHGMLRRFDPALENADEE